MASIEELLNEMEDILSDARGNPFSGKRTVDVEALKLVLEDLRANVPEEIKQAQILASERREILDRATREADMAVSDAKIISRDLIASAEKRSKDMEAQTARRTEELMRVAQAKAQQTVAAAKDEVTKAASQEGIVKEAEAQAEIIRAEAERTLNNAKRDAARILEEAEYRSNEKLTSAEEKARDLKLKASAYVNDIVTDAEYRIGKSYAEIKELQKTMNSASRKTQKVQKQRSQAQPQRKKRESAFETEPRVIHHPSVIDIPLEDEYEDYSSPFADDPPLHEKSNYNIEL